jgi:hypothetical protein
MLVTYILQIVCQTYLAREKKSFFLYNESAGGPLVYGQK